jgi:hypothetical protein
MVIPVKANAHGSYENGFWNFFIIKESFTW